jgi:ComF family protein
VTGLDARTASPWRRAWTGVLDAVFPPRCVSCGSFESFLCGFCEAKLTKASHPRCGTCWQPSRDSRCAQCREDQPAFTAVRSAFVFGGPARDLVHALKYDGVSAVAPLMAAPMAELLLEWDPPANAIAAVPMAGSRQRRRGFNQADLLAREISRRAGLPLVRDILRRRPGPSQVEQPDRHARTENVRDAFRPGRATPRDGVLLIDDSMTSGATLDACARVLKTAGWGRVYALTFARES